MNILDTIIAKKKIEVEERKQTMPISQLEQNPAFKKTALSLTEFLLRNDKNSIIAEFKRQSPSKGIINATATVEHVTNAYAEYGGSAISVLTDETFFGGGLEDLTIAVGTNIPVLRKDFIIDEYQIVEAKAIGASVILLIAACHSPERVRELALFAKRMALEVLLEIHSEDELNHICTEVDIVGVNNRDLKTFTVDVERSVELADKIPADKIKISESGISDPDTIIRLKQYGFKGFLIGETFMKQTDPTIAFADFVNHLKAKHNEN